MTKNHPGVPTSWTALPSSGKTVNGEIHLNTNQHRAGSKARLFFSIKPAGHDLLKATADVTEDEAVAIVAARETECLFGLYFDEDRHIVLITTASLTGHELKLKPSAPQ